MISQMIDILFAKLQIRYGRDFLYKYDGIDIELVKEDWAIELSCFENWPDALKYGINNLPIRPPNVIEFKNICLKSPAQVRPELPPPTPNPEKKKEAMQKIQALVEKMKANK